MLYKGVLAGKIAVNLWLRIHNEIIMPVGSKQISIDQGFSKFVKIVYGTNTYLSLTLREKLNILLDLAYVSHAIKHDLDLTDQLDHLYESCALDLSRSPN